MSKLFCIFKICSQLFSFLCCINTENTTKKNDNFNEEYADENEYSDENDDNVSQNYALNTIICYSKFSNDIYDCTNKIYNSSDAMRYTCDYFAYSFKYLYSCITQQHIEPMQQNWIRVSVVQFYNKYEYECNYHFTLVQNDEIDICKQYIQYSKELHNQLLKNNYSIVSNPWYSMKYMNKNTDDYGLLSYNKLKHIIPKFEKSAVRFLLIEYTHPSSEQRLQIEIDASWYIVGNELFSFTMILHLLKHQSEKFVFDKNYTIYIMDNNIERYELKYNEYILLNKHKFQILS